MKSDMQTIEELMNILRMRELTEISWETSDIKINIKAEPILHAKNIQTQSLKVEGKEKNIDKNHQDIVSEHVGKYNFIKKDGSSIISIGQNIKVGQELGYVMAVGIALPVVSKISGTIEDIYVKNGEPVDYGKPLIKVRIA